MAVLLADPLSPPIDRAELAEITRGDPAVEHRLLRTFRRANDADVAALLAAIDGRDAIAVVRVAHRLMGAARMAGATLLANLAAGIARTVQAGDWSAVAENSSSLHQECARINRYLDALLIDEAGVRR